VHAPGPHDEGFPRQQLLFGGLPNSESRAPHAVENLALVIVLVQGNFSIRRYMIDLCDYRVSHLFQVRDRPPRGPIIPAAADNVQEQRGAPGAS